MLTYLLPLAFTKMQQGLELSYNACLKMCSFRDSCVKCLSSGFCFHFIFFSLNFSSQSYPHGRELSCDLKSGVNPTYLGQLQPRAQIPNPCKCRCAVWIVALRKKTAFTLALTQHLLQLPARLQRSSLGARKMCC